MEINLENLLKGFFRLPDWKERSLKLGGIYLLFFVALFFTLIIAFLALEAPIAGVLFLFFFVTLMLPTMIIFFSYLEGYKLDVAEAFRSKANITSVKVLGNYKRRFLRGIRLNLAIFIYSLPLNFVNFVISFIIGFIIGFNESIVENSVNNSSSLGNSAIQLFANLLIMITSIITSYFITPIISAQYVRTMSFKKMFDFSELWAFVIKYKSEIANVAFMLFLVSLISLAVISVAGLSVFVCLGLFLLPASLAIGVVFNAHVSAELIAKLSEEFDKK